MGGMSELVGKTIVAVYPDRDVIYFETDDGVWRYETEGDCCSTSWFEAISGSEALLGGTVASTEEETLYNFDDDDDYIQVYGIRIVTNKGRAVVEFRNSSNGYYGGWVNNGFRLDSVPNGVSPIQDDWSAWSTHKKGKLS